MQQTNPAAPITPGPAQFLGLPDLAELGLSCMAAQPDGFTRALSLARELVESDPEAGEDLPLILALHVSGSQIQSLHARAAQMNARACVVAVGDVPSVGLGLVELDHVAATHKL